MNLRVAVVGLITGASLMVSAVSAQNNSLYRVYDARGAQVASSVSQTSLINPEIVEERPISKHDIFTIRVEELARFLSEADAQRRTTGQFNFSVRDWVRLNGFRKMEATQQSTGTDPTVDLAKSDNRRAQGDVETSERLTMNVAVEVVDIRPNGNLVLEGRKEIRVNDEVWLAKITGTCRQEDIGFDRVILSEDVLNLRIERDLRGFANDSIKRGWLEKAWDRVKPF